VESGPSKMSEILVGWLVPPACREEVLGDMRERHPHTARYLLEAAYVIPCVIYSRICRTTDGVVALMQALSIYTAFVTAAWLLDRALLLTPYGFVRLAIPPALCLAVMILTDAYSDVQKRAPIKPLFAPAFGFALAYSVQSVLHPWALPAAVFGWGSAMGFPVAATLRLTFPPVTDRPQTAKIPAFWQKLEHPPFSLDVKSALLSCGILLAVILYLFGK
jgi:hypothetical protein